MPGLAVVDGVAIIPRPEPAPTEAAPRRERVTATARADLAPEQRALLDTIAGTEAPDYHTVYGGRRVGDLSRHPGIDTPIQSGPNAGKTSSAAGRYQFLKSTWDGQARKLGLADFSPESQDIAAWDLAESTYGGSLADDLRSGDPAVLANVGKRLSGVWTSLPGGIERTTHADRFAREYQRNLQKYTDPTASASPMEEIRRLRQARVADDAPLVTFHEIEPAAQPATAAPAAPPGRAPGFVDHLSNIAAGAGDIVKSAGEGLRAIDKGAGWVADNLGFEQAGDALREGGNLAGDWLSEQGQAVTDYFTDPQRMSPEFKARTETPVFDQEWNFNPQAIVPAVERSAAGVVAMGGVGKTAMSGLERLALEPRLAGWLGKVGVPAKAAKKVAELTTTGVAYGGAEGVYSGALAADQARQDVVKTPLQQLLQQPGYVAVLKTLPKEPGKGLKRGEKARELYADLAAEEVFKKTAASTGMIGALTGGGVLGALERGGRGGLVRKTLTGAGEEAIQEGPQSGAEAYIANSAQQKYLDPTIDPWRGVPQEAASGAVVGAAMGGALGAGGAVARPDGGEPEAQAEPPPDVQTAGTEQPAGELPPAAVQSPIDAPAAEPSPAAAEPSPTDALDGARAAAGRPITGAVDKAIAAGHTELRAFGDAAEPRYALVNPATGKSYRLYGKSWPKERAAEAVRYAQEALGIAEDGQAQAESAQPEQAGPVPEQDQPTPNTGGDHAAHAERTAGADVPGAVGDASGGAVAGLGGGVGGGALGATESVATRQDLQSIQASGGPVETAVNPVEQSHEEQKGQGQGPGQERLLSQPPEQSPGVSPAGAASQERADTGQSGVDEPAVRAEDSAPTVKQSLTVAGEQATPWVEHTTAKGKTLRGVVRKDVTVQQARAIDPFTFKKDGGFFIREKYVSAAAEPGPLKPAAEVGQERDPDALVAMRTIDGDTVRVKQGDLDGGRVRLPTYRADGVKRPALVHRENLDPDGLKAAAAWRDLPAFLGRDGAGYASQASAEAQVKKAGQPVERYEVRQLPDTGRWIATLKKGEDAAAVVNDSLTTGGQTEDFKRTAEPLPAGRTDHRYSAHDAVAREYGFSVGADGVISKGDKPTSVVVQAKKGRLALRNKDNNALLASYAGGPDRLGTFLEKFWYAEKQPANTGQVEQIGGSDEARPDGQPKEPPGKSASQPVVARLSPGHQIKITRTGETVTVVGSLSMRGQYFYVVRGADGQKNSIARDSVLQGQKDGLIQVLQPEAIVANQAVQPDEANSPQYESQPEIRGESAKGSQNAAATPATAPERQSGYGENNKVFTQERAERAREILRRKLNQMNTGFDPEIAAAGLELAGYHIEAGARAWADYVRAMVADIGDSVRPYLRSFYESARHAPGLDSTGMSSAEEIERYQAAEPAIDKTPQVADTAIQKPTQAVAATNDQTAEVQDVGRQTNRADGRKGAARAGAEAVSGTGEPGGAATVPGGQAGGDRGTGRGAVDAGGVSDRAVRHGAPGARSAGNLGGTASVGAGRADVPDLPRGDDYRITPGAITREGSWLDTARRNVEIVELVHRLEREGRPATADEQAQLARFTGWGAADIRNQLFPSKAKSGVRYDPSVLSGSWRELGQRVAEVFTPADWKTALRSTQYAHYTSEPVVRALWQAAERFGFAGGAVLEPGAGIGHFAGLMPDGIYRNSRYLGIEMDGFTARIAQMLYPGQTVRQGDYVKTKVPGGFFDLAIGNPPFAATLITDDPEYARQKFSLHDYFFAKTLDRVRTGGLLLFVTSRHTLDKQTDKARQYLADRADFLGAIRLPNTAFKDNAGTQVVTDIIMLRKREAGQAPGGESWTGLGELRSVEGEAVPVNEYFARHPEMILGQVTTRGDVLNASEKFTVDPQPGELTEQMAAALERLPQNVYSVAGPAAAADTARKTAVAKDFNPKYRKEGGVYLNDAGELLRVEQGVGVPLGELVKLSAKDRAWLGDYVPLRDALKQAQYDQLSGGDWETSLQALNVAYDGFVKRNGPIQAFTETETTQLNEDGEPETVVRRRFKNDRLLRQDVDGKSLVFALEKINEDGSIEKAAILKGRVLKQPARREIASVNDALAVSLADTGRFDPADVARLAGLDEAAALAQLGDLVYAVPGGGHVLADEYLSGDVKTKLDEAEAAAAIDRSFARNVEALTRVQPAALASADVTVGLGATWVPLEHYREFAREVVGLANPRIAYHAATNEFAIEADDRRQMSRSESAEWGTAYRSPLEVLDAALNRRTVKVYTGRGTKDDPKVLNVEETQKVETLTRQLAERFSSWVWTDAPRTAKLLELYNDRFNRLAPRYFDGEHINPPGLSLRYKLHPHQKRAIWRAIQTGNTYFAHAVGAGKTLEMIIAGMEQKRLGLINKPMYVVPGHMLEQFAAEFLEAYPAANIMVADEENFAADNRRRFIAQAALNSPDAIIITHSAFTILEMKPENQAAAFDDVLDDLRGTLEELPDDFENRKTRSKIEAQLERIERAMSGASTERFTQRNKLQDLQAARREIGKMIADLSPNRPEKLKEYQGMLAKQDAAIAAQEPKARKEELNAERDKSVLFEDLGVDFLFVDEAHEFRKLDYATKMTIKGLSPEGSVKALKLFVKTRWLEKQRPGRAFAFASGTPITNTLAELYTIQRFFHEQELRDKGLIHFDAWAANFAQVKTEYERNATGKIEAVDRLSKFVNVADLMSMVRQQMDVLTSSELAHLVKLPTPVPGNAGKREIIVTPQTEALAEYMGGELSRRLEESRAWKPTKEQPNNPDPVINIITDGRVAALDMRYIDPSLPNDPDSKLNHLADRIIQHYQDTADLTYTDPATGQVEPVKGGTQIVFASLGFGPGIAQTRGFDGRAWINKRLREAGIPANQVAWIWDYPTAAAKQAMFKEMRQGQKRILLGSPKNMGTGVNVQKRLTHKIDLDAPWYPSDLEQPDGRILRQGNQNEFVTLEGLAAEGTYDSTMYGMVSRKAGFIEQAFRGDRSLRTMEDISAASSYAMAAAIASGDPRYMQLTELESTVAKLETEKELHERRQSALRRDISVLKGNGPALRERIQTAEKVQQALDGLTFYSGYLNAVVAGRELHKAKTSELGEAIAAAVDQEFAEALATVQQAALKDQRPGQEKAAVPLYERVYEKVIGTIHGKAELVLAVQVDARRAKDGKGKLTDSLHSKHQSATVRLRVAGETSGWAVDSWQRDPAPNRADSVGRAVSTRLNSQQRDAVGQARSAWEENQDALEKAERAFGVPFPRQAALVQAVTDLANLRAELTSEGKEVPEAAVKASVLPDFAAVRAVARGGDKQSGYLAAAYGWPGQPTAGELTRNEGAPQLRRGTGRAGAGNLARAADQAAAQVLNRGLAKHFNDPVWEHAYVQADLPESLAEFAKAARAAFGAEVVGIVPTGERFDQFNGVNHGGRNYVNLNGNVGFVNVAGHEIWHQLKKDRPDLYQWFAGQARRHYRDFPAYRDRLDALLGPGERPHSLAAAEEELLADFAGDALADPAFVQRLAEADPSRFRRLLNAVRRWLHEVAGRLRAAGLGSSQYFQDIETLRGFLVKALVAYGQGGPVAVGRLQGPKLHEDDAGITAKFSRSQATREAYEKRIDELLGGAAPEKAAGVRVLDRSDLLDMLGFGNYEVVLAEAHAVVDGMYNHGLTASDWKKIPDWIDDPVAVFERDDGNLTFIGPELKNGVPLIMGVKPEVGAQGRRGGRLHILLTAYHKDSGRLPVGRMLREGGLRFVNLRKSPGFNSGSGLRLPSSAADLRGLSNKVATERDLVKYRAMNPYGGAGAADTSEDIKFSRRQPDLNTSPAERVRESSPLADDRASDDPDALAEAAQREFAQVDAAVAAGGGWTGALKRLDGSGENSFRKLAAKARRTVLGALTVHQLVDVGESVLPRMRAYLGEMSRMDATRNRLIHESDQLAQRWGKLPKREVARVGLVMHESTIAGVDGAAAEYQSSIDVAAARERIKALQRLQLGAGGDKRIPQWQEERRELQAQVAFEQKREREWARVKALHDALTPEGQAVYAAVRDYHAGHLDRVEQALVEMIEKTRMTGKQKYAAIQELKREFETMRAQAPYFPLGRFGDYWVHVAEETNAAGKVVKEREFEKFETYEEAESFYKQKQAEGRQVARGKQIENLREVSGVSATFVAQVEDLIGELGANNPEVADLRDQVYQLYLRTLPEVSARKHAIHRGKVAGYAQDALRTFANKAFHDAYAFARIQHGFELRENMEQMREDLEAAGSATKEQAMRDRRALLEGFRDEVLTPGMKFRDVKEKALNLDVQAVEIQARAKDRKLTEGEQFVVAEAKRWDQYAAWFGEWHKKRKPLATEIKRMTAEQLDRELAALDTREQTIQAVQAHPRGSEFGYDLYNELQQAYQWLMNPTTSRWASLLNAVGFGFHLALSPAAWITNATQTPLIAVPYVAGRHGQGKTWAAFKTATGEALQSAAKWRTGKEHRFGIREALTRADEIRAYAEALDRGLIDRGRVMDLIGLAEEGAERSGLFKRFSGAMALGFQEAERLNRETTFMAAYRLERDAGKSFAEAVDYADKVVNETHFNYAAENRARFMRPSVARVLLQFKSYAQHVTYLEWKMVSQALGKAPTLEAKREARRFLAVQTGLQLAAAGAMGLPLGVWGAMGAAAPGLYAAKRWGYKGALVYTLGLMAAAVGLGADDPDDPVDWWAEFEQGMSDWFGPTGGQAASRGLVNALGGIDLSSRVSMADLWWREIGKDVDDRAYAGELLSQLAGPSIGVGVDALEGVSMAANGHAWRGVERMVPKPVRDLMQALRFAKEGALTMKGDPLINEPTPFEVMARSAGFTPSRLAARYAENRAEQGRQRDIEERRRRLLNTIADALIERSRATARGERPDGAAVAEALAAARAFNAAQPRFRIGPDSIKASMQARRRARARAKHGAFLNRKLEERYDFAGE